MTMEEFLNKTIESVKLPGLDICRSKTGQRNGAGSGLSIA
jgi:hypothetical protein